MILGICTGQVYITLNLFIIVLEAFLYFVTLEMNEQIDNVTNFRPAVNPKWHSRTHNCVAVKSYRRHNNFSVVWIENLSNSKHFHISAMSNYTLTMTFFELTVVTATSCPSRRRSFDGFNYSPSKGNTH